MSFWKFFLDLLLSVGGIFVLAIIAMEIIYRIVCKMWDVD